MGKSQFLIQVLPALVLTLSVNPATFAQQLELRARLFRFAQNSQQD